MNLIKMISAAALLAVTMGAPAYAQMQDNAMSSSNMSGDGHMMKMSMADKRMMTKCGKMSHAMMMKSKGCMKMMKMHPDMMK